jgi:DNA repair protein RadC
MKVLNQENGQYLTDDEIVSMALAIVNHRFGGKREQALSTPSLVKDYLRLSLMGREHEVFVCIFLDAQNRVIAVEEMFRGTLTQTAVYPREVIKACLHHNAGAVIFAHNHPSGIAEPSRADEALTTSLKQGLAFVDVRVLDHMIVGTDSVMSFAERGLI